MVLTCLYNDLREGDKGFVERNAIIAIAFGAYNTGPVKVAVGPETTRDCTHVLGPHYQGRALGGHSLGRIAFI
ncbi:hypothetical protein DL768_003797 [Monosporascus sp. mg162]|nr:hypothetical protein DL768_003797 [Monosporascus sp. mg162]